MTLKKNKNTMVIISQFIRATVILMSLLFPFMIKVSGQSLENKKIHDTTQWEFIGEGVDKPNGISIKIR